MCKSQAEGGQRCSGHARTRMEAMQAQGAAMNDRLARNDVDPEEVQAKRLEIIDAMVDYASTSEGSVKFRQDLAAGEALHAASGNPDAEAANEEIRQIINQGAERARTNRAAENAYRATHGKKALTTPLPLTLTEEAAQRAANEKATADAAAKKADPFGLRSEQQPATNLGPDDGERLASPSWVDDHNDDDGYPQNPTDPQATGAQASSLGRYDDSHNASPWVDGDDDDDNYPDDLNYPVDRRATPNASRVQSVITTESGERVKVESGHRKSDLKKNDLFIDAQGNMKRVVGDTGYGRLLVRPVGLRGRFSDPTREGFLGELTIKVIERNVKG